MEDFEDCGFEESKNVFMISGKESMILEEEDEDGPSLISPSKF